MMGNEMMLNHNTTFRMATAFLKSSSSSWFRLMMAANERYYIIGNM